MRPPAALAAALAAALVAPQVGGPARSADATLVANAPELAWEIVSQRPHDPEAYTQGLQLIDDRLFESTGLLGRSSLREVDPRTGDVLRTQALPDDLFGEGLASVDDRLIQLTWQSGQAMVWEAESFDSLGSFTYEGEGWGLCHDGGRLVMSDGSDQLTFRDPETFEVLETRGVTVDGVPLTQLNELECVDGSVWANVWLSDLIVRIDPTDGRVDGWLNLDGIMEPDPAADDPGAVLNGIAWDEAAGTFLVTGKHWPALFEIRVSEPVSEPA